jgi:hypothetical protein
MELLLVLALLVVAGGIATPAITGAFTSVKLRRAGDAVLARWAQARAQAIETGVAYQFRFTPETGKFRVEPWTGLDQEAAASDSTADAETAGRETAATRESLDESPTVEDELPQSILFHGGQAAVDDPQSGERRVDSLQTPDASWSTPILFFPDGTASHATVVLKNDAPLYLRLTLRGLTGVARASDVLTREEMDRGARER